VSFNDDSRVIDTSRAYRARGVITVSDSSAEFNYATDDARSRCLFARPDVSYSFNRRRRRLAGCEFSAASRAAPNAPRDDESLHGHVRDKSAVEYPRARARARERERGHWRVRVFKKCPCDRQSLLDGDVGRVRLPTVSSRYRSTRLSG